MQIAADTPEVPRRPNVDGSVVITSWASAGLSGTTLTRPRGSGSGIKAGVALAFGRRQAGGTSEMVSSGGGRPEAANFPQRHPPPPGEVEAARPNSARPNSSRSSSTAGATSCPPAGARLPAPTVLTAIYTPTGRSVPARCGAQARSRSAARPPSRSPSRLDRAPHLQPGLGSDSGQFGDRVPARAAACPGR